MNATTRADQLRRRAHDLRRLADDIEASAVMRLDRHAGDDTWRGARPALCRATLRANQQQLHWAADDLRWHAERLVRHAEELEVIARSQIGLAG